MGLPHWWCYGIVTDLWQYLSLTTIVTTAWRVFSTISGMNTPDASEKYHKWWMSNWLKFHIKKIHSKFYIFFYIKCFRRFFSWYHFSAILQVALQSFAVIPKPMPGRVKWSLTLSVGINPTVAPYIEGKLAFKETLLILQSFTRQSRACVLPPDTASELWRHSHKCQWN